MAFQVAVSAWTASIFVASTCATCDGQWHWWDKSQPCSHSPSGRTLPTGWPRKKSTSSAFRRLPNWLTFTRSLSHCRRQNTSTKSANNRKFAEIRNAGWLSGNSAERWPKAEDCDCPGNGQGSAHPATRRGDQCVGHGKRESGQILII